MDPVQGSAAVGSSGLASIPVPDDKPLLDDRRQGLAQGEDAVPASEGHAELHEPGYHPESQQGHPAGTGVEPVNSALAVNALHPSASHGCALVHLRLRSDSSVCFSIALRFYCV